MITSTTGLDYIARRKANAANLLELRAGNLVMVVAALGRDFSDLRAVERVTATQILVGGTRYDRATGEERGNSYSRKYLDTFVDEALAAKEIKDRHNAALGAASENLSYQKLQWLSTETLEAINVLVEADNAKRQAKFEKELGK